MPALSWESDEILSTMDLLPTIASIAGADLPDVALDGKDATDFLTGQSVTSHDRALFARQ